MNSLPLADVRTIAPFLSLLDRQGQHPHKHLKAARISGEMVAHGEGKITKHQVYHVLDSCQHSTGLADLGYQIGESHGLHHLVPIAESILRSATLKEAIETLGLHLSGWMGENKIWLHQDGSDVWLCNAADDGFQGQRDLSNQCGILTFIDLIRTVAGQDWRPAQVKLEMQPSRQHRRFEALSSAEIEFTRNLTAVRFPARFLPLSPRPSSRDLPASKPAATAPDDFLSALSLTLQDQLPYLGVPPSLHLAAEIAGTSTRTLQRQLTKDGLSYRRLLDRIRFHAADRRLKNDPQTPLRDLAADLGYSSTSNFIRAFHRIAGVPPGAYRDQ
jgi:AraC-like DNA-binding protein